MGAYASKPITTIMEFAWDTMFWYHYNFLISEKQIFEILME